MSYRESISTSATEATYAIILTGQLSYDGIKEINGKTINVFDLSNGFDDGGGGDGIRQTRRVC